MPLMQTPFFLIDIGSGQRLQGINGCHCHFLLLRPFPTISSTPLTTLTFTRFKPNFLGLESHHILTTSRHSQCKESVPTASKLCHLWKTVCRGPARRKARRKLCKTGSSKPHRSGFELASAAFQLSILRQVA